MEWDLCKVGLFEAACGCLKDLCKCLHVESGPAAHGGSLLDLVWAVGSHARTEDLGDKSLGKHAWEQASSHQDDLQSLLKFLAKRQQNGPGADREAGACHRDDHVSMQKMVDEAEYGQPGDVRWPPRGLLQRMSTASAYGYWAPASGSDSQSVYLVACIPARFSPFTSC